MTKDTFVNLNLLYEEIEATLIKFNDKTRDAERWLDSDTLRNEWMPSEARTYIQYVLADITKAKVLAANIQEILLDFKMKGRRKPARVASGKPRIAHMNVIKGGIYKPAEVITDGADDILSETFKAWRREQIAKTDQHDNA